MPQNKTKKQKDAMSKLLEKEELAVPQIGDIVKGKVLSASKSEVKIDVDGMLVGVVRGRELYRESPEYADLKPGAQVEATVIDLENENGELELSFSYAGHQKTVDSLNEALKGQKIIKVKVKEANKGGLIISCGSIVGFLPVSQLSPENYPRVSGGDKGKILEKLKKFINQETEVKVMDFNEKEDKLIVSEKAAWSEQQKDVISKYKPGTIVEGRVTAITDFGVFISFGDNLEGLIHISELAWQRIENPANIMKVGDKIKAEIINIDGAKIFLSAKRLVEDPWKNVKKKYKINDKVKGKVLKVNPFGLFVELDDDIHALAHISAMHLKPGEKLPDKFAAGKKYDFYVISMEPQAHRLGLGVSEIRSQKSEVRKVEKAKVKEREMKEKKTPKDEPIKQTEKEDKKETVKKRKVVKKKEDKEGNIKT